MTLRQEAASWWPFGLQTSALSAVPDVGTRAPSTDLLPMPATDGKATIVTFLRHCGCPFAEKTLLTLRDLASSHPELRFVAVSHSSPAATATWLAALQGAGRVTVVDDESRTTYTAWGLGPSSFGYVLNPWTFVGALKLGREEGIWNRPTESGSRWQMAGSFGVDGRGLVRWVEVARGAYEVQDLKEGVEVLERKQ